SEWEGMPNALMEALLAARPVVACDVGGVRELVTDKRMGYVVPPRSPIALAEAMLTIMELSDDKRREMGIRGYEHVVSKYDLDQVTNQWCETIDGLLSLKLR